MKTVAGDQFMGVGQSGDAIYRDSLQDELRRIELAAVDGERKLAEQEALIVSLKKQNLDVSKAEAELEMMRENQRLYEQDRQRLIYQLRP
jgi:hypothetical protein